MLLNTQSRGLTPTILAMINSEEVPKNTTLGLALQFDIVLTGQDFAFKNTNMPRFSGVVKATIGSTKQPSGDCESTGPEV